MSCYEDLVCVCCNRGDREETLLLCDGCDRGFHCECIGLPAVPDGDWFCNACNAQTEIEVSVLEQVPLEPESTMFAALLAPLYHLFYMYFEPRILFAIYFALFLMWVHEQTKVEHSFLTPVKSILTIIQNGQPHRHQQ